MTGSERATCARDNARSQQIAALNDQLRKTGTGGAIMITRGVRALPAFDPLRLLAALAAFNGFDEDNDPHGEHDFGDVQLGDAGLLWKIDYYDSDLRFASPDPGDAAVTRRVLTVMLPEEW